MEAFILVPGDPKLPPITDELTSVLALYGQHAFALALQCLIGAVALGWWRKNTA